MDKIICVGKNYLKHAQELGDGIPEEPLFFIKPPSTILNAGNSSAAGRLGHDSSPTKFEISSRFETHHELELVLRLSLQNERLVYSHYTFGLDLTLRDLQTSLKKAGQPWEKAKVFKNSAVLGPWQAIDSLENVLSLPFELKINGQSRQRGLGNDMRWKPAELLNELQQWFPLCDGDLLFTGTPEGVGPLHPGEELEISGGKVHFHLRCTPASSPPI